MEKNTLTKRPIPTEITMIISNPNVPEAKKLTKDDVWGTMNPETFESTSEGMIIVKSEGRCPVWKDKLPYKSVTVVCDKAQEDEVSYWLQYVHGGNSISKRKVLAGDKVALRSNYMCW